MMVKKHLEMLGMPCKDRVTGLEGIITSVGFDLYGCVQAIVHPGLDKDGNVQETLWFDIARLSVTADVPVMERPNFDYGPVAEGRKGPSEKPRVMKS